MASEFATLLLELAALLVAAKLLGELAERVKQPAVLGELLAGVLLGPTLLGLPIGDVVKFIAELGAVLLLFEVGLETRFRDMLAVGRSATLVALVGIVGSFAFGFALSYLLGAVGFWSDGILFHVFVGATLTATSVGITARVLSDLGRLATPEARIILGAAVLDDVGGLLILAFVTALAGGALSMAALATKGAIALGFLAAVLLVGIPLAPRLLAIAGRGRARGVVLTASLAVAFVVAALADLAGLAAIVGAFAAGLVIAGSDHQPRIVERVKSLADVLVPIFFVFVGMQVDLRGLGSDAFRIAIAVVALLVVGVLGKLVCALAVTERGLDRLAVGVGMVPRGEVGLIFALFGLTTLVDGKPLLEAWEYASILVAVALTTFLTPVWLKWVLARRAPAPAG